MEKRESSLHTLLFYCVVAIASAAVNVLFCSNRIVGIAVVFVELAMLLYQLLKKRIYRYTALSVIFISNCMEFSYFVGQENFYNMKSMRIFGINIGAWVLIVLSLFCCLKPIKVGIIKREQNGLYRFGTNLIKLNIIAAIVGFILIIFNDNNIAGVGNVISGYIACVYSSLFIPIVEFLAVFYIWGYEKEHIQDLYLALQATALANSSQIIISFLFGKFGFYGGVSTLLVSTVYFVLPLVVLLMFDQRMQLKKTTLVVTMIGISLSLVFNTHGKLVLTIVFVAVIVIIRLLKGKRLWLKLLAVLIIVLGFIFVPIMINTLISNSVLFRSKYAQVLTLFQWGNDGWIQNLSDSPRARVEELKNVCLEFVYSPWLVFTGKGYMGSIRDHTGYFSSLTSNSGLFSTAEWNNGTYYNLHEITSSLLLYGFLGVAYSISLIKYGIKNYKTNAWTIVGIYWFILLYGYSFTLSCFGAMAFFVGLLSSNDDYQRKET